VTTRRATLIRWRRESMQPGKTPRAFAELLFDHTNMRISSTSMLLPCALRARQAGKQCSKHGRAVPYRVINPICRRAQISVIEGLNDNMPFPESMPRGRGLAERGIEVRWSAPRYRRGAR